MAFVFVDRVESGQISVRVQTYARDRAKLFDDRREAERFAWSKVGRDVMVSTLDMTPEQLAAHRAREERLNKRS